MRICSRREIVLGGAAAGGKTLLTVASLQARMGANTPKPAAWERRFAKSAPAILGALLNGLVAGLRYLPEVKIADPPRMADAVLWGEACTRAYWPAGTFVEAYRQSQAASVELVLEASTVGSAVVRLMEGRDEWEGPATELLDKLTGMIGERAAKERDWPKKPNVLSNKLRRAAPALRKVGINISFGRREEHAGAKVITIKRTRPEGKGKTSTPPPPKPSESEKSDESKANHGVDGADQGPNGVDPPPDGVDHGVDVVSMAKADIDTNKSLKNNAGVDGADGGGVSSFPSGPAGNGADRLCAQCGGGSATGSDVPTVRVGKVWLHAGPCRRFWLQETTSSRKGKESGQ